MYTHRIVIGDWSRDGHNMAEYFTFNCSHSAQDVLKAYKAAVAKSKIALHSGSRAEPGIKALCADYEDGSLSLDDLESLKKMGIDVDGFFMDELDEYEGETNQPCYPDDMANLFFAFAKTEIPGMTYDMVKESTPINQDLGFIGYGCFHN